MIAQQSIIRFQFQRESQIIGSAIKDGTDSDNKHPHIQTTNFKLRGKKLHVNIKE